MAYYPNGNNNEPNPNYIPPASVKRNTLIRICESDDWMVDYDRERGMYRVSYFEDNHFKDEYWFDCFEEKEITNKTELIEMLELLKENSKDVLGEHKYISGEQFREILDRIIVYINK